MRVATTSAGVSVKGMRGKGMGMDIETLQNPYPSPGVQGFKKSSG